MDHQINKSVRLSNYQLCVWLDGQLVNQTVRQSIDSLVRDT